MEHLDQLQTARKGIRDNLARLRQQRAALPAAAAALTEAITGLAQAQAALDRQIAAARGRNAGGDAASGAGDRAGDGDGGGVLSGEQAVRPPGSVCRLCRVGCAGAGQRPAAGTTHALTSRDAELRRLLYLCALANLRSKDATNPFKVQYERERAKGLATTAAVCAVARKLARLCWSLAAHGTHYEATRVHQQPRGARTHPQCEDAHTP